MSAPIRAARVGAAVECTGLVHVYQVSGVDTAALRGIDFSVAPGETMALFGPSGSGKSTLLAALAGIRQPSAGEIRIDGTDIARASERALRAYRRNVAGVLLQDATTNLLSYASALDNVQYARRGGRTHPATEPATLLEAVGLNRSERTRPVSGLSRGKQQAAALAAALSNDPRLLLADEPTSELRPAEARALIANLLQLSRDLGITVVTVTHDPAVAAAVDRTLHLRDGRIGAEATSAQHAAVVATDGSIQLPDSIFARWRPGTLVQVDEVDESTLRVRRLPRPAAGEAPNTDGGQQ